MSKDRGFTLIELLIVIGIIGVLSSLALAYYNDYVQRAADASSRQTLRYLENAVSSGSDWIIMACGNDSTSVALDFKADYPTCVSTGAYSLHFEKLAGSNSVSGGAQALSYWDWIMPGIGEGYNNVYSEWIVDVDVVSTSSGDINISSTNCQGEKEFSLSIPYNFPTSDRDVVEGPLSIAGNCS